MSTIEVPTLVRLTGSGLAVADPQEDIRGRTAYDREGRSLGRVDDLYVDEQERKVRLLELGAGADRSLVPVDAVAALDDSDVHLDALAEKLAEAPPYEPAPKLGNPTIGSVYGHYGYAPYWGADYRKPQFPYFS
jgi:hypothetical protein